ncbi:MAG: hypothetical protein HUU25_05565 [Candidatus Sumerlaeia bacterium]|nr:hypothetical protein [Candidatus Sumerlaeia bacterium]
MRFTWVIRQRRGISLVSTMVGIVLVAGLLITNAATLIYTARTSRIVSYRLAARNVAQGVYERMIADLYTNVTPANYPSVASSEASAPVLDSLNNLRAGLTIEIQGDQQVTSATASSITVTGANWEPNRWAGNVVCLTAGRGFGQRALITGNTPDTLNVSLLGMGQPTFVITPDATTQFAINGGKMVRITASFQDRGRTYTETLTGLVVRDD